MLLFLWGWVNVRIQLHVSTAPPVGVAGRWDFPLIVARHPVIRHTVLIILTTVQSCDMQSINMGFWSSFFFIRKIAQLIETLHKIGHYRGLARLIWKLMSVNVIIRQEYSPFLILLKWCHHKIQIQINNDVQSLVPDKIKNCDDNKNKNQVAHKINN